MSRRSPQALWNSLAAAGLTAGDMPAEAEAHTPWYVRTMLGVAGVIAAAFLVGFVGAGFAWVMESHTVSVAVGSVVIAGAYLLFRMAPRGDFSTMFALATSLAGQLMAAFGIFGLIDPSIESGTPFAVIAVMEAALALVMPNFLHRAASACAAGVAFDYACQMYGAPLPLLPVGVIAAAVAWLWLNEVPMASRHSLLAPIAYGLTLSLVQIEGAALFGDPAAGAWPWAGEGLVFAALLVSVEVLLQRAGWPPTAPRSLLALAATLTVGLASFEAPGIAAGLMIALLGFAHGNRVLRGLGIAALVFFLFAYYYLLHATLLAKAGVLLATGLALLAARRVMLRLVLPEQGGDA